MRFLVADDSDISRLLMQEFLLPHGESTLVKTGEDAVRAFAQSLSKPQRFDIVWVDFNMPGLNGEAVLERIRELEKQAGPAIARKARVVLTTALAPKRETLGFDHILRKPLTPQAVADTIRRLT